MTKAQNEVADCPALVLFRNDLRLADNKALAAASSGPLICLFVWDEASPGIRPLGAARRWWLHHSLLALDQSIRSRGGCLVLRSGPTVAVVRDVVEAARCEAVYWNRRYAPAEAEIDAALKQDLRSRGLIAESFDGQLLHEPTRLKTGTGGFYKVYGAFKRALEAQPEPRDPIDVPDHLAYWKGNLASEDLSGWSLLPGKPDWAGGLRETWKPGEAGAEARLDEFLEERLDGYAKGRDYPARTATSGLSPHLANGEITPYRILARLRGSLPGHSADAAKLRSELLWREFSYHLLFNVPALAEHNFNAAFDDFPWRSDRAALKRWRRGQTGYPIVDAGMRELWQTGTMHNRIRMVVASFLTKHLLIDWRIGEQWFWDTLVDADPASNPANWQWVAGSGADAAPYFRIFNPVLQGEKFDAGGIYTRRFVPEIAQLPDKLFQKPWLAPASALIDADVKLGSTYPVPVVDHDTARQRALAAFKSLKGT